MELRQLEYFVAVTDSGAFSRAALRLGVSQPLLTRQIKSLEQELGLDLYCRTGRGIVLTEAGKLLQQHARCILETSSRASSEVRSLRSTPTGKTVIGMPPSVGALLTVPMVRQFRREFPRISLGIIEGFSGHVLEWLTSGRIDVAVLYDAPRLHTLVAEPLLRDELFLLGPAQDPAGLGAGPVAAARLAELPLILPSRPHGLRLLVDAFLSEAGILPNIEIEIDAMPSTLSLVEGGEGYTILSFSSVHDLVAAGRIRAWRLVEPSMTRQLILATSTQRPMTQAPRVLTRIVREQVQRLVREGRWPPNR